MHSDMTDGVTSPSAAVATRPVGDARAPGLAQRSCWPRGLVGMLVLVLLVESFINKYRSYYRDVDHCNFFAAWRQAGSAKGKYDVVCLGDSVMKMAVVPQVVETKLGRRVYNMAVCGSQAPETYFLVRRMLESGARPAALVVNFFPRLQELGPWHSADFWMYTGLRESFELCSTAHDATLLGVILSKRILPSCALRWGIRAEVRGALKGQPGRTRQIARMFRSGWAQHKGAQLLPANPNPTEDLVLWQKSFFGRRPADPTNVAFIHRFLKFTAAHDIPVFWLLTPVKAGLQAQCELSGFDAEYSRYLEAIRARFPNVTVVDARHSGMGAELFFDPHHLGIAGAEIYSEVLGEVLRRQLDSPDRDRWVQLVANGRRTPLAPESPERQPAVAASAAAMSAR